MWSEMRKLGKGSLTCADRRLYCYAEADGTAALVEATPKGWTETGRFRIPRSSEARQGGVWTHPVVANGRLFLRDEDRIFVYDVKAGEERAPAAAGSARILDFEVPGPGIAARVRSFVAVASAASEQTYYLLLGAFVVIVVLLGVLAVRDKRRRRARKAAS